MVDYEHVLSSQPQSVPRPTIQNIVSVVNLDCKLDLITITQKARNAEYNPKRFSAVIMRIKEPKTTALIFSSGKLVCTGAKSEDKSKLAARKFARIVQKIGFPIRFKDFKIQNIVSSCDVKFPIRLEVLQCCHRAFAQYEPELFPGLIYRMKKSNVVALIFVSGKIVITGAKTGKKFMKLSRIYTLFWYSVGGTVHDFLGILFKNVQKKLVMIFLKSRLNSRNSSWFS